MTAPTTRETADHAELARLCEDALIPMPEKRRKSWFNRQNRFRDAFTPSVCSALLSEIVALRVRAEEADALASKHFVALREKQDDAAVLKHGKLEAERQRDELRGEAVKGFALIHTMLMTPSVPRQSAGEVANTFLDRIANQGADQ